jgi:DNA-binding helix-hairpin-helix protein with protein kinase domain/Flp pilus assembly protein TadD
MTTRRLQVYNSQGQSLYLADKLKQGGEGAVYDVQGHSDLVAKIYHGQVDHEKSEKLALMVSLQTERLLKLTAWPIDKLLDRPRGRTIGFLMNKIIGYEDVHVLYGVKSRLAQFPEARWPFLIQTASNIARAFRALHEQKHVIGDINHGSVGVSKNATVKLFDCDSFQITAQGRQYLCAVGIDTHTPPELQGHSLQGVLRTPNHDAFGLAVIVFQLLFLGRHPFAGKFLGAKETPPLQRLISEYRFAYGPGARSRLMEQPAGTIPLEAASLPVANLFERAFASGGVRPSPEAWAEALTGLASNLKPCAVNSGHTYLKSLPTCPWCKVEGLSGVLVFTPVYAVGVVQQGQFSLAWVWAQIASVQSPGPLPALPQRSTFSIPISPESSKIRRQQFLRSLLAGGTLIAGSAALFALPISISGTVSIVLIAGVVAFVVARSVKAETRKRFDYAKQEAQRKWKETLERWRAQAGSEGFETKKRDLDRYRSEYEGLPALRLKKLNELERNLRQRQLEQFLDRHRIAAASISGIGPSRQATLRSFGIETAADVNLHSISQVPGFGRVYTSKMLGWRHSIEQRFVFNPARGVDPTDKNAVEKEIAGRRAAIERDLRSGSSQLRQMAHHIAAARTALAPILEATLKDLSKAEQDRASLRLGPLGIGPIAVAIIACLVAMMPLKTKFASIPPSPVSGATTRLSPSPRPTLASTPDSPLPNAKQYYSDGVELTKARKYQQAISAYQKAIALDPTLADAHHELAFAYYKTGKFKDSVASSQQAIKLKPDDPENYRNLGLANGALQKWKDAIDAFEQTNKLAPNDPLTQYQLGLAYKNNQQYDPAIDYFEKAIKLKSDFAQAHYELGALYLALDEPQLATEQYNILLKLNPKLADKLQASVPTPSPD